MGGVAARHHCDITGVFMKKMRKEEKTVDRKRTQPPGTRIKNCSEPKRKRKKIFCSCERNQLKPAVY